METSESDVDVDALSQENAHEDENEDEDGEEDVTALDLNRVTNQDEELVRDYYVLRSENITVKAYAQFVKYRVGRMSPNWLPKSLATLKSRVYKIIGIPPNPIELVDSSTPVIRLKRMISYWMAITSAFVGH